MTTKTRTTTAPTAAATKTSRTRTTRIPLTDDLAAKYLPRVQRHAARIARKLPRHVQVGDLVSAGFCGLVDAFLRFDPTRMESFEAYIDHRIRGAILDELRHHDPLTRDQRAFVRSVSDARQSFSGREGRMPDERELAAELGVTLARYRHQVDRMHATAVRSDATPFNEDEDRPAEPANDSPDAIASTRERNDRIACAMNTLAPRLRDVLRLHYHEGRTLREIGVVLGVTESRVSQIHGEAVIRLREVLSTMPL